MQRQPGLFGASEDAGPDDPFVEHPEVDPVVLQVSVGRVALSILRNDSGNVPGSVRLPDSFRYRQSEVARNGFCQGSRLLAEAGQRFTADPRRFGASERRAGKSNHQHPSSRRRHQGKPHFKDSRCTTGQRPATSPASRSARAPCAGEWARANHEAGSRTRFDTRDEGHPAPRDTNTDTPWPCMTRLPAAGVMLIGLDPVRRTGCLC
jgi:hypothetical protein